MDNLSGWAKLGKGLAGGFEEDRKKQLRDQAQQDERELLKIGYKRNEQGMPELIEGSKASLELDILKLQLAQQDLQTKLINNRLMADDLDDAISGFTQNGDVQSFNRALAKNPLLAERVKQQFNTINLQPLDFNNPEDLKQIKALGIPEEFLSDEDLQTGMKKAYFKSINGDGTTNISSLFDLTDATNYANRVAPERANKLKAILSEVQGMGAKLKAKYEQETAIVKQGLKQDMLEADQKFKTEMLEDEQKFKMEMLEANHKNKLEQLKANRNEGLTPFDVKTAEYFGKIKSGLLSGDIKPDSEEAMVYETWLMGKGGTDVSKVEYSERLINSFEKQKNVDLKHFDVSKATPEDQNTLNKIAKHLEATKSGTLLLNMIGKDYQAGMGTIVDSGEKLLKLMKKPELKTNVVKNWFDNVKEYFPQDWIDLSNSDDMENMDFRKSFVSLSGAFLKILSGLTVSDKEREQFEKSYGTLSRQKPALIAGIKVKLEETLQRYRKYKVIEPKLYNIKYSGVEKTLEELLGHNKKVNNTQTKKDLNELDNILGI
jgi:hypothetical protein